MTLPWRFHLRELWFCYHDIVLVDISSHTQDGLNPTVQLQLPHDKMNGFERVDTSYIYARRDHSINELLGERLALRLFSYPYSMYMLHTLTTSIPLIEVNHFPYL